MNITRTAAPIAALLAVSVALAACAQVAANPEPSDTPTPTPVASPSSDPTPKPTPKPVKTPAPAPAASEAPAASDDPKPTPKPVTQPGPIQVIEHPIPMLGRSLADAVNVRARPDVQAELVQILRDGRMLDVRLGKDQLVRVNYGPVLADGESWYHVQSFDHVPLPFAGGWVAGRFLARERSVESYPIVASVHALGEGAPVDADVPAAASLIVEFAAAPLPGSASCDINVTLIDTERFGVQVANFRDVTDPIVAAIPSYEVADLYQEVAGRVTLQVDTDCSFAAVMLNPQG